jgi:hypothetical protein
MSKSVTQKRTRNRSNVGAVAGGTATAPGERAQGSPHGSNARQSYLTLRVFDARPEGSLWDLVQVDFVGALGIPDETVHAHAIPLVDCAFELASWCEGLGLPYRDYRSERSETFDPAGGYPL